MAEAPHTEPKRDKPRHEVLGLFREHLDLVEMVVSRLAREISAPLSRDELVVAGQEGLFRAAQRYDPEREVPFRVYAHYRVRGAVLDWVRQNARLPRRAYERLLATAAACLVSDGEALAVFNACSNGLSDAEAESYLDEHLASVVTAAATAAETVGTAATPLTPEEPETPEDTYEELELLARIRSEISHLDEVEGRIVELMYFEGMNLEGVSRALRMSKPWACRLHARAIQRLTKRLRNLT